VAIPVNNEASGRIGLQAKVHLEGYCPRWRLWV